MQPFLLSSVLITKPDGTRLSISGDSDEPQAATPGASPTTSSHMEVSSKRERHSGSNDIPGEAVPIIAIVFTFIWLIVKAVMAPFTQRKDQAKRASASVVSGGLTDEEQAILYKLQQTITQMERRIESLETILIDQSRTNEKYGTKH